MPARLVVAPSRQYGQKSIGTQGFLIRCKVTAQKHTRCPIGVLLCRPTTLCLPLPEPAQSPRCFCLLAPIPTRLGCFQHSCPLWTEVIPTCHQRCRISRSSGSLYACCFSSTYCGFHAVSRRLQSLLRLFALLLKEAPPVPLSQVSSQGNCFGLSTTCGVAL